MAEALSHASQQPGSLHSRTRLLERGVEYSVERNAPRVLAYLIEQGADVTKVSPFDLTRHEEYWRPPLELIALLIAHRWDINTRGPSGTDRPLLCVTVPDASPANHANGTQRRAPRPLPAITEMAAAFGIVSTFELLQEKGAPLGKRTLHRAVEQAAALAPLPDTEPSIPYRHRMRMIQHLVDVEKLDVNPIERELGSQCRTPLCYPAVRATGQDVRELTRFLLDRGADPVLEGRLQEEKKLPSAIECAEEAGCETFLEGVMEHMAADVEALRLRC